MYFKADTGYNCHEDQIIDKEIMCKVAASRLGLTYIAIAHSKSYPAGCFWNLIFGRTQIWFNKIIDISQTDPDDFGSRGGLCIARGKY